MKESANPILKEIKKSAQAHPEKLAVQDDHKKLTYSQLIDAVKVVSERLKSKGVLPGDRLALPVENSVDILVGILGVIECGGTVVLLDPRLPTLDFHELIKASDPFAVLSVSPLIQKLNPDLMPGIPVWDLQENLQANHYFTSNKSSSTYSDKDPEVAIIMYTSGTSGHYKGVMLSNKNILAGTEVAYLVMDGSKNFYCVLPIYHIYSLICCVFNPLFHGGSIHFITLENIFKAFQADQPTVIPLVPRMLEYILAKLNSDPVSQELFKKSNLKMIELSTGGAPLSERVEKGVAALGFLLIRGYGLSETTGPAVVSPSNKSVVGSAGGKTPLVDIRIDQPDDKGVGEICIHGSTVMKGYFQNKKATSEAIIDGWFHSGDLGYIDDDGNLFVTGRIKDVIVLPTGDKSMPDNVEAHYAGIKGVKELTVFGMRPPGQVWDEIHAAIVVENPQIKPDEIEGRVFEKGKMLPFYLQIQKIHFVKEIPKTSVQKVRRALLREQIQKG